MEKKAKRTTSDGFMPKWKEFGTPGQDTKTREGRLSKRSPFSEGASFKKPNKVDIDDVPFNKRPWNNKGKMK